MHVLDIAQNSVRAGASLITISFTIDDAHWLTVDISDDGCGMSPALLANVSDPFTTTRTTRKVGLGIPLLVDNAQRTGGKVSIVSKEKEGTSITATFNLKHIDCPPMGAMCDTLLSLVVMCPQSPAFVFTANAHGREASFDTRILQEVLQGVALNTPEVVAWMRASINDEFKPILEV